MMKFGLKFNKDILVLSFLMLACGGLGAWRMHEWIWDLANYHYYNPWALFHGRIGYDLAPAGVNTYFNPLLDIPLYFMVECFNEAPRAIFFVQGLWTGGLLFFVYKTAGLFFGGWKEAAAAVVLAATGFGVSLQLGTSTGDTQTAVFALGAFYFLLKDRERPKVLFWCGLALGAALGLKPTNVIYCISSGLALMFSYRRVDRRIILFALGGLAGYLLTNGWWLWIMWRKFDNPFFPFLNGLFNSEWTAPVNYRDTRFLPTAALQWVFFPFYGNAFSDLKNISPDGFDARFAGAFLIAIGWQLARDKLPLDGRTKFLAVWLASSYLVWLLGFSIFRYLLPAEALLSIVFVKAAKVLLRCWRLAGIPLVAVCACLFLSAPLATHRALAAVGGSGKLLEMERLNIRPGTLLVLSDVPTAFLVPLFNEAAGGEVRAIASVKMFVNDAAFTEIGRMKAERDRILLENKGDIAFVFPADYEFWLKSRHEDLACRPLENSLVWQKFALCVPKGQGEAIWSVENKEK